MFDRRLQNITQKPLIFISKFLIKIVNPIQITLLGFVIGILMCLLIFFQLYLLALILLILNRLCDGLDGTMARLTKPTPLGGYLDIVFDFIIYAGFVLAFGLSNDKNTNISIILLFLYIGTGTTFLAKAAIQTQLEKITKTKPVEEELPKSFHYTSGLIEGSETIIFMVLCLLFPNLFFFISLIFGILCLITLISRIIVCYFEFNL